MNSSFDWSSPVVLRRYLQSISEADIADVSNADGLFLIGWVSMAKLPLAMDV